MDKILICSKNEKELEDACFGKEIWTSDIFGCVDFIEEKRKEYRLTKKSMEGSRFVFDRIPENGSKWGRNTMIDIRVENKKYYLCRIDEDDDVVCDAPDWWEFMSEETLRRIERKNGYY